MNKAYKKAFIRQQDQSDCGVACLASLVRYYGGEMHLERLRELSGTDKQGTTMLGLFQAANAIGFEAEAFEADIENLRKVAHPTLLHVIIDNQLQHFVICYGYNAGKFIISDPAKGVTTYSEEALEAVWQSHALLVLKPVSIQQSADIKRDKKYWIKQLIKEDINILGVALVLGAVVSLLSLATAIFSQKLIDDILPEEHLQKLWVGLGLLFFLLLVKSGISYIRQSFLLRQAKAFNNRIINYFFGALMYLPKPFFDNRKTGDLVARLNDTIRIQSAISYITTNLMIDVLMILLTVTFIAFYSGMLGLIALAILPLYFLIVYCFHQKIVNGQREVMAAYAKNESNYVDTIQGIGAIKGANKEGLFAHVTKNVYDFFQLKIYALGHIRIRFNLVTEIAGTVIIVSILTLSSIMVLDGEQLKLGQMMAVVQMTAILLPSAGRLALTNIQLQEARVAFDRMYEFTSILPEYIPEEDQKKDAISDFQSLEVTALSFRFPGRSPLLKGLNFSVQKGEMITLFGESGSGKSTTMQILQKFYRYEEGEIAVNGQPWNTLSMIGWRKIIAIVPQQVKIFNGNLIDNICMGTPPESNEAMMTFLTQYGFDQYFQQFPQGFATLLGEGGVNISGGQQQVVALARALYHQPQLLLLDEATAAMDRNTEAFVIRLLHQIKKEMGIITISHRVKTARNCDRIYVLENGTIVASGPHDKLMQSKNLYSDTWNDYLPQNTNA